MNDSKVRYGKFTLEIKPVASEQINEGDFSQGYSLWKQWSRYFHLKANVIVYDKRHVISDMMKTTQQLLVCLFIAFKLFYLYFSIILCKSISVYDSVLQSLSFSFHFTLTWL